MKALYNESKLTMVAFISTFITLAEANFFWSSSPSTSSSNKKPNDLRDLQIVDFSDRKHNVANSTNQDYSQHKSKSVPQLDAIDKIIAKYKRLSQQQFQNLIETSSFSVDDFLSNGDMSSNGQDGSLSMSTISENCITRVLLPVWEQCIFQHQLQDNNNVNYDGDIGTEGFSDEMKSRIAASLAVCQLEANGVGYPDACLFVVDKNYDVSSNNDQSYQSAYSSYYSSGNNNNNNHKDEMLNCITSLFRTPQHWTTFDLCYKLVNLGCMQQSWQFENLKIIELHTNITSHYHLMYGELLANMHQYDEMRQEVVAMVKRKLDLELKDYIGEAKFEVEEMIKSAKEAAKVHMTNMEDMAAEEESRMLVMQQQQQRQREQDLADARMIQYQMSQLTQFWQTQVTSFKKELDDVLFERKIAIIQQFNMNSMFLNGSVGRLMIQVEEVRELLRNDSMKIEEALMGALQRATEVDRKLEKVEGVLQKFKVFGYLMSLLGLPLLLNISVFLFLYKLVLILVLGYWLTVYLEKRVVLTVGRWLMSFMVMRVILAALVGFAVGKVLVHWQMLKLLA